MVDYSSILWSENLLVDVRNLGANDNDFVHLPRVRLPKNLFTLARRRHFRGIENLALHRYYYHFILIKLHRVDAQPTRSLCREQINTRSWSESK